MGETKYTQVVLGLEIPERNPWVGELNNSLRSLLGMAWDQTLDIRYDLCLTGTEGVSLSRRFLRLHLPFLLLLGWRRQDSEATERPGLGKRTLLTAHFWWSTVPLEVQSTPGCKQCLWHEWLCSFKGTLHMNQTDSSRGQGFLRVQGRQNVQIARPGGPCFSLSRWGAAEGIIMGLKPVKATCWNCLKRRKKSQNERGNKGRNTAEGQLEVGPGFPETELGLFCEDGESLLLFYFLKLRTILLEFKRNTRRQTNWRSQRKTVQALASIQKTR